MNELKSHPNERSWEYECIVKKDLKKLKITTYTNTVHLLFDGSIDSNVNMFSLEQSYVGWPLGIFLRTDVERDPYWFGG